MSPFYQKSRLEKSIHLTCYLNWFVQLNNGFFFFGIQIHFCVLRGSTSVWKAQTFHLFPLKYTLAAVWDRTTTLASSVAQRVSFHFKSRQCSQNHPCSLSGEEKKRKMLSRIYRDGNEVERSSETAPQKKKRKVGEEMGSVFRVGVSQILSHKQSLCLSGVTVVSSQQMFRSERVFCRRAGFLTRPRMNLSITVISPCSVSAQDRNPPSPPPQKKHNKQIP